MKTIFKTRFSLTSLKVRTSTNYGIIDNHNHESWMSSGTIRKHEHVRNIYFIYINLFVGDPFTSIIQSCIHSASDRVPEECEALIYNMNQV